MDDNFIGFDVSKRFFDYAYIKENNQWFFQQLEYNKKGLTQLIKSLPKNSVCVMEATGPYYIKLARTLNDYGYRVCVVNPLVIRRYSQMLLRRTKTDKADAKIIAMYGKDQRPAFWQPNTECIQRIPHMNSVLEALIKDKTRWNNKIEAAKQDDHFDKQSMKTMKQFLAYIERKIEKMEDELDKIIEVNFKQENDILRSIPGIGKKTSIVLLAITGGFTKFENYKQFASYIGICPRIFESGSSV